MNRKRLFTVSNPKTLKGEKAGYRTAGLHLAPASLSGFNVCASSTAACRAACLNTAGRGGIGLDAAGLNAIQKCRIEKTQWFFADRSAFMSQIAHELDLFVCSSERLGLEPVVRMNVLSDLRWERIPVAGAESIMALYPEVQFYDYTKHANRRGVPKNYHLTFSLAESDRSWRSHLVALESMNVAVVLSGCGDSRYPQPMPRSWNGRRLIDGDQTDLRFTDRPRRGAYVGLRAKGRAIGDRSGFVYDVNAWPAPGTAPAPVYVPLEVRS